jgi:hypothetical protein
MVVDRLPITLRSVLVEFHQPPGFLISGNANLGIRVAQSDAGDSKRHGSTRAQGDLKTGTATPAQFGGALDELFDCGPRPTEHRPRLEAVNDTGLILSRDDDAGVPYDDLSGQEPGCWRRVLVPWSQVITITCRAAS